MISIREAKKEDLEQLTAIYNWAIINTTATFDIEVQTVEKRAEWFSHYGGNHPLIVAELDGKIVGYGSLSKFREKEAYARTVENSIYIHPEYHGRGIGKIILKELIELASKRGHHVIVAGITAGNDISVKMHEEFGFKFCGEFKEVGFKFGRWQDCQFYQILL